MEAYITEEDSAPRVRRLHLMVVDLHRRRRMTDRVLRLLVDLQVDRCAKECLNTLPIPWKQNQEAYQLRYVLDTQWMAVTFRAIFFGPHGQQNNPSGALMPEKCENHVRELRTFFTVVLEPNIHTFSVLSETLQDFLKSKLC